MVPGFFKAAQLQEEEKALLFLRKIKEMVFLEKKNIAKWEHLLQAALETGLDALKFKDDFENGAKALFEEDLALARQLGVRGFPSIFFTDEDNNRFLVYGSKPYGQYEQALLKLYPDAVKKSIDTSWETSSDIILH
jgi:predicted DsbA family dithiol-disulfide isomerase